MTNLPLVSVIISTYNSSEFLEQAIRSVIVEQTYPNIELIIVDDFSTNGTREKLLTLQEQYKFKLILLRQNSGSASKPTNQGIDAATGKYIAVCAHDDFYLPNKLAVQVEFLEKNPQYMAAFSKCYYIKGNNTQMQIVKSLRCYSGFIFKALFTQKFYIPALTMIIRKDVFDSVGYFDEKLLIEDWDMWLKIANQFPIGFINEYLACYRHHDSNSSKIYFDRMTRDRNVIIEKWQHTPYYQVAKAINRLIDGMSIRQSALTLCKDTFVALMHLKQPYRVGRLFLSNIRRRYFNSVRELQCKDSPSQ